MEPKLTAKQIEAMIAAESHLLALGNHKQFRVRLKPSNGKEHIVIKNGELHEFSDVNEAVEFYNK